MPSVLVWLFVAVVFGGEIQADSSVSTDDALRTLQLLEPGDANTNSAVDAAKAIQRNSEVGLIDLLTAMREATPIGKNWLASIASLQFSKRVAASATQEQDASIEPELKIQLEAFLAEQSSDAEARALVFGWLTADNDAERTRRLVNLTNDPSPELRFAAIELALMKLQDASSDTDQLTSLLNAARHPDQVRNIISKLKDAGVEVNQAKHFAFIDTWHLIGPFDNSGEKHFETAYPIESDVLQKKFDPKSEYEGKSGKVSWQVHTTEDVEGKVDLAEIFSKEKGAVVYGYATFRSETKKPAQIRLTSVNANRVWFNGKLVLSNQVYHSGTRLDQYSGDIDINVGDNSILVKLLQNEQTDDWAQDFQFHLRITDETGQGILGQ